jgi:NhaP-type Na+/H+ or K+/H+ antiporter
LKFSVRQAAALFDLPMSTPFELTLLIVLTVLAGVTAQVIGEFFKVPSIIFLLLFGIGLGPDGLGLLHPQELGVGLEVIVALSVALILFEGGLSLELSELGQVSDSLRNLVTVGIFVTLVGGGMASPLVGRISLVPGVSLCLPGGGDWAYRN